MMLFQTIARIGRFVVVEIEQPFGGEFWVVDASIGRMGVEEGTTGRHGYQRQQVFALVRI